ncbi:Hypothetical predicted protein [Xyrichtys novacula]|uniref:Uncharacterized protein n=1 Tax=Xyrichtys novacula TaxID=13765 RepID=A0AAV1H242_XYRNO|nr:Hypothetical predicted protein [Xyrichtys novacula]
MKPGEVRCGNPSQYEAERETTVTEGGVWAFLERITRLQGHRATTEKAETLLKHCRCLIISHVAWIEP